ncbi:hypothetical protein C0989_005693 [Termitomyces sp. Mn162]|nr:hypothetical protein C0989_005693 [Termitomyces sp. Mn162]
MNEDIQEIFGSHYVLPDLGPLGANGLANARDFEYPLAHFDADQSPWNIAWHGNYVPYKYAMEKFVSVGSISKDHIDPSILCVLTAPSKTPNAPLADFLIFSPRWDVANGTFRPPKATESDLAPMKVNEGSIGFMFETSMMLTITDYAMHRSGKLLHEHEPKMWDDFKAQFMDHLDEVKAELEAADLPNPLSGTRF